MMLYGLTYLFSIIAISVYLLERRYNKILLMIFSLWLILFAGVRDNVGIDFNVYKDHYLMFPDIEALNIRRFEIGFESLISLLKMIGLDYQAMFFVVAFITIYLFAKFYALYSKSPILSLILFFLVPLYYLTSLNTIRQFLAVAIFAISIKYILSRSIIKYITLILIATLFHRTALFMIPVYFIGQYKPSIKLYITLTALYIFSLHMLENIIRIIGLPAIYLDPLFLNEGLDVKAYIYLGLFIIIFMFKDLLIRQKYYHGLFINMLFISTLILFTPLITELPSGPILRVTSYFTIVLPILLANLLLLIKEKHLKWTYLLLLILSSSLYFWGTLLIEGESLKLVPYNINLSFF